MLITLPDSSPVHIDEGTLRFSQIGDPEYSVTGQQDTKRTNAPFGVNCRKLAATMKKPSWKFGDSFRRISDHPRYSPKRSVHQFDVTFLTKIYQFPRDRQGGTFSSSTTEWSILDGGIISHMGYGWGSHCWTVVEGAEALRAVCLFFGIIQPRTIKGEPSRRPLAALLEELSEVPLQSA